MARKTKAQKELDNATKQIKVTAKALADVTRKAADVAYRRPRRTSPRRRDAKKAKQAAKVAQVAIAAAASSGGRARENRDQEEPARCEERYRIKGDVGGKEVGPQGGRLATKKAAKTSAEVGRKQGTVAVKQARQQSAEKIKQARERSAAAKKTAQKKTAKARKTAKKKAG